MKAVIDSARYFMALIVLISIPPVCLFWLLIHGFTDFWRKIGPAWTYGAVGALSGAVAAGLVQVRELLLARTFGTSYLLSATGVLCLTAAVMIAMKCRKQLSARVLIGLPELAPSRYPSRLLAEGIYARVRHPRYIGGMLAIVGYALVANYLVLYAACALFVLAIYLVVLLEERELRDRFGEEYEAYCRKVPRFVPRSFRCSGHTR